jgi:membrane dipeptidase
LFFKALPLLLVFALSAPTHSAEPRSIADLLTEVPVIDGHNDLPFQYFHRHGNVLDGMDLSESLEDLQPALRTDIPRLRRGGVGAQFWSVFVPITEYGGTPGDAARVLAQMDLVRRLAARYPDDLELAFSADDVRRIHAAGRVASLMGMEGGHAIEDSLGVLRSLYAAGARYLTLTHSKGLHWADSATDQPRHDGLTDFGKEVVREMNRLGMLVDLSHVSAATMHDALDVSEAPVIFSHSSARAVTDHARNVPDSVLERLPDNGGVVMVTFVATYVNEDARQNFADFKAEQARLSSLNPGDPEAVKAGLALWREDHPNPGATLADVADHIDHIRDVAGIEYIGLGGDYDGTPVMPKGLEDVSTYPALLEELRRRGYSDVQLQAIAGGNVLRVMERSEAVAAKLQRQREASDMLIASEEAD